MSRISRIFLSFAASALFASIAHADKAIEITGNDQMQYNVKEFEVAVGEKVTLTFKNIGVLPKVAMGHNVVVLKPGTDVAAFAMDAMKFPPEYIPEARKGDIIAKTLMLGPGESATIEFTADAAGVYPYVCTFPGHFAIMQGKMTAK